MTNYDGVSFFTMLLLCGSFSDNVQSADNLIVNQNLTLQQGEIVENIVANFVLTNYDPCKIWPLNFICVKSKNCENEITISDHPAADIETPKKRNSQVNLDDLTHTKDAVTDGSKDPMPLFENSNVDKGIIYTAYCGDGVSKFLNCYAVDKFEADECCRGSSTSENTYIAVANTCDAFYQCANLKAVHVSCPEGLHFNKVSCNCDWPSASNCNDINESKKIVSSTQNINIATKVQSNAPEKNTTNLPNNYTEENKQSDDITTVRIQPSVTVNDSEVFVSTTIQVQTNAPTKKTTSIFNDYTESPKFSGEETTIKIENSLITNESDTFVTLSKNSNTPVQLQSNAPKNETLFFPSNYTKNLKVSDEVTTIRIRDSFIESVGFVTNSPTIPCVATTQESADECCVDANNNMLDNVHIKHGTNCYGYYVCELGVASYNTCPPGLYFDENISACNLDVQSDCRNPNNNYVTADSSISVNKVSQNNNGKQCKTSSTLCADGLSKLLLCNVTDKGAADECCRNAGGGVDEYILDATSCGNFYQCSNLNAEPKSCPASLHFNGEKCVCDWPSSANCIESGKRKENVINSRNSLDQQRGQVLLPCIVTNENGANACCRQFYHANMGLLIADDNVCSVFYQCSPTGVERKTCPTGLHYNRQKLVCDWPNPDNCAEVLGIMAASAQLPNETPYSQVYPHKSLKCKATDTLEAGACCKNVSQNINYYIADAANCSRFYQCSNSVASMVPCPTGLYFSTSNFVCVAPHLAKCLTTVRSNINLDFETHAVSVNNFVTTSPEERRSYLLLCDMTNGSTLNECCKNAKLDNDYFIVDSTNCSNFYQCAHDTVIKKYCASNLYFNPKSFLCDWPIHVNCAKPRTALSDTNCKETRNSLDYPTETTVFGSSTRNNDIIINTTSASTSNPNLSVNNAPPQLRQVVDINAKLNAEGLQHTIFCSIVSQENIKYCCSGSQIKGTYFPDATNCSQYFQCDIGGRFHLLTCPVGLHFNAETMICDWPNNVNCEIVNLLVPRIYDRDFEQVNNETSKTVLGTGRKFKKHASSGEPTIKKESSAFSSGSFFEDDDDIFGVENYNESKHVNENGTLEVVGIMPITADIRPTMLTPSSRRYKRPPSSTTSAVVTSSIKVCNASTQSQADICCLNRHNTNISDTSNCSRYFKCYNGKAFLQLCKQNFQFNRQSLVCDSPSKVNCLEPSMKSTSVAPNTSKIKLQPTTANSQNLTLKESIRKRISQFTDKVEFTTDTTDPVTIFFNQESVICVASSSVEANKCCENGAEFVPDKENCTKYYRCVWKRSYQFYCPAGTHFNKILFVCDFPSSAGCM